MPDIDTKSGRNDVIKSIVYSVIDRIDLLNCGWNVKKGLQSIIDEDNLAIFDCCDSDNDEISDEYYFDKYTFIIDGETIGETPFTVTKPLKIITIIYRNQWRIQF